jgi:hypothetical protein
MVILPKEAHGYAAKEKHLTLYGNKTILEKIFEKLIKKCSIFY